MPPPVALVRHPQSESRAVRDVQVRIDRTADGTLALGYLLTGNLARVRVPPPQPRRIADRLWEHTCCEVFIAQAGRPAYHEFNFAPSGEWMAHAFQGYRDGAPLADVELDPRIATRATADALMLDATIRLARLAPALPRAGLALALSVGVEDDVGAFSRWALKHPPGKPDFHHPDAFALVLDEIRD
jgi:hypothetical protein